MASEKEPPTPAPRSTFCWSSGSQSVFCGGISTGELIKGMKRTKQASQTDWRDDPGISSLPVRRKRQRADQSEPHLHEVNGGA